MTTIEEFKATLGDFARDLKINLTNVISTDGAPGLSAKQIQEIAYASALSLKDFELAGLYVEGLTPDEVTGMKTAVSVMAMNNVYYRFLSLVASPEFSQHPAKLRMTSLAQPGVPKVDFELASLAVSALFGCAKCINAHVAEGRKHGVSDEGIQSVIRIASVIHAAHLSKSIAQN